VNRAKGVAVDIRQPHALETDGLPRRQYDSQVTAESYQPPARILPCAGDQFIRWWPLPSVRQSEVLRVMA